MLKIDLLKQRIFYKCILVMFGMLLITSPFIFILKLTDKTIIMILIVWLLLIPILQIFLVLTTKNIDKDKYELNKCIV